VTALNTEVQDDAEKAAYKRRCMGDCEQRCSNYTPTSENGGFNVVEFYFGAVRDIARHSTNELQLHGKSGFWAKMHAVDCLLWTLVML